MGECDRLLLTNLVVIVHYERMFLESLPPRFVITPIVRRVQADLEEARKRESQSELERRTKDSRPLRSFEGAIGSRFGLIAEIKRKSPSIGEMRENRVEEIALAYEESSAVRAISVLTNRADFGMGIEQLGVVGKMTSKPLLRKDFIFDPYQVWEARASGADAILLMANILTIEGLRELSVLANGLGLGVLFEVHTAEELAKLPKDPKICGINSRVFKSSGGSVRYWASKILRRLGLKRDLSIKLDQFSLVDRLPAGSLRIAESGIDPSMVGYLRDERRFSGLLVGTSLLMAGDGIRRELGRFEQAIG